MNHYLFLTIIILFYCIQVIYGDVEFTMENQFSPTQYNNPNGAPSPNDTTTTLSFIFDSSDGTDNGDGTFGFVLDISLPNANNFQTNAKMTVTYTPEQVVRVKQLLGTIPQKIITVKSIIREDRSNSWFINTGNVQSDVNTQSLLDVLFVNNDSGRRRLRRLLDIPDDNKKQNLAESIDEKLSNISTLKTKLFIEKQTNHWDQVNKKYQNIVEQLWDKTYHFQQSIMYAGRHLLQSSSGIPNLPPNSPDVVDPNPVQLSPSAIQDIDTLNIQLTQYLNQTGLGSAQATVQQGAGEVAALSNIVNKATVQYASDLSAVQNLSAITGPEYNAFQAFMNQSSFAQYNALTEVAEATQMLNNRTAFIAASATAAMQALQTQINILQTSEDVMFNGTYQWLQTLNFSVTDFGNFVQAFSVNLQGLFQFENVLNQRLLAFYNEEDARAASILKEYEIGVILETAGYQVVKSTLYPPQQPLGYIPLQSGNVGKLENKYFILCIMQN